MLRGQAVFPSLVQPATCTTVTPPLVQPASCTTITPPLVQPASCTTVAPPPQTLVICTFLSELKIQWEYWNAFGLGRVVSHLIFELCWNVSLWSYCWKIAHQIAMTLSCIKCLFKIETFWGKTFLPDERGTVLKHSLSLRRQMWSWPATTTLCPLLW